jgi:hypothetical protein
VVQAEVTETFTLASGEVASVEKRLQDIVLFRKPSPEGTALAAQLPITPSRRFSPTEVVTGQVVLDILAGREAVRGTIGGSQAATLESGPFRLSVRAAALPQDRPLALESVDLSGFLPGTPSRTPGRGRRRLHRRDAAAARTCPSRRAGPRPGPPTSSRG